MSKRLNMNGSFVNDTQKFLSQNSVKLCLIFSVAALEISLFDNE